MKWLFSVGLLLLTTYALTEAYTRTVADLLTLEEKYGLKHDMPPSDIKVVRPGFPYDYGEYGIAMDNRETMTITCTAKGKPPPQYRWEFNGGPLPDNPRITQDGGILSIEEPAIDDEGKYQCFAYNDYGTALSAKYDVIYAYQDNYLVVGQKKKSFTEGDNAVIACMAPEGAPKPRIYWNKERTLLDLDQRISITDEGDLYFSNILGDDADNYYCFAANDLLGTYMRSPAHVVTIDAGDGNPRAAIITELPTNVQGLRTREFTIKCLASGFPTPDISWFKEGEELPGTNSRVTLQRFNQELQFKSLGFEDAGSYECQASNSANEMPASQSVHLTVQSEPYFTSDPTDKVIAPGDSTKIRCEVNGVPQPDTKWLQNGDEIRETESSTYTESGNTILINDARKGDSTVFQCIADNVHGEKVGSYTITVLAIPATISNPPKPRDAVSEGDTLSLRCVTFGSPTPTVEWYFEGTKIEEGGRYIIVTEDEGATSTLNVTDLMLEDGGTYECHALNSVNNSMASSVISVKLPTSVKLSPAELTVVKGSRAVFLCNVTVDYRATDTIKWYLNDVELHPRRGSEFALRGKYSLVLQSALSTHNGVIKCLAVTEYDEAFATADLVVKAEPNPPYNVELVINGLEAALSWTAPSGNNAEIISYTIQYRTQYRDFPEESGIEPWAVVKEISASSSSDTVPLRNHLKYSFRVTATNEIGTSRFSEVVKGNMTASAPPGDESMPQGVNSDANEPGKMTISWDAVHPVYHNGPDFAYVVRWREEGEEEWQEVLIRDWEQTSFEIDSDKYKNIEYNVGVTNKIDTKVHPGHFTGTTGQGTPIAAPSNVRLEAISSEAINVTWDPVSEDDINGKLVSINVYYTMQSAQGSTKIETCGTSENSCVVGGLQPFTTYEVAVSIQNEFEEGPKSNPLTIKTQEAAPSIAKLQSVKSTSYRLAVSWDPPAQKNGIHLGYHLWIAEYEDDMITQWHNKTIEGPEILMFKDEATPDTRYEVFLTAYSGMGDSISEKADTTTAPAGKPSSPGTPILNTQSTDHLNISWGPVPDDEPKPDKARACYKVEGAEGKCQFTDYVDVLDADMIMIKDLETGTKYEVYIEFKNKDDSENGAPGVFETTGPGSNIGKDGFLTPWFIAIICIIIFLLLILLIICILKSQKGGKYNVSDKEKQLQDENAPLKNNDGFAEFNQDSEFPDEMDGSQDSLASNPDGSEGDSLKEYADDEDPSKFNEEGSFIEEYHDPKTRSTDVREGGTSTFV